MGKTVLFSCVCVDKKIHFFSRNMFTLFCAKNEIAYPAYTPKQYWGEKDYKQDEYYYLNPFLSS